MSALTGYAAVVQGGEGHPVRVLRCALGVEFYWPFTNDEPMFRVQKGDWIRGVPALREQTEALAVLAEQLEGE